MSTEVNVSSTEVNFSSTALSGAGVRRFLAQGYDAFWRRGTTLFLTQVSGSTLRISKGSKNDAFFNSGQRLDVKNFERV